MRRIRMAVVLTAIGIFILVGCGSILRPDSQRFPDVRSSIATRLLYPLSNAGHATSVLQGGDHPWVAVQTGDNLSVKLIALVPQRRTSMAIPRNDLRCSGTGSLRLLGSTMTVVGCGANLWLWRQGSWIQRGLPSTLVTGGSITATAHRWWFLAFGVGASGNEAVTLWSSINSGVSWNRWDASTDQQQPNSLPYYGDKTGIAVDAQGGLWLTGSINGLGMGWLYHSQDSKHRWTATKLSIPTNWADTEVTSYPPVFSNSSHGYLPVTVNGNGNGIAIYSAKTSTAWKLTGTVAAPVDVRWDMSVSSPKTLWIAVGHRLWVSHDGGTRWHDAWKTPRRWDLVSVSFSGPRDGVLLAVRPLGTAYALWITRDGGQTWLPRRVE